MRYALAAMFCAVPSGAQIIVSSSTPFVQQLAVIQLQQQVKGFTLGRSTITGRPTFQNGICFSDGSCQTIAVSSTPASSTVTVAASLYGNGAVATPLGVNSSSVPVFQSGKYPAADGSLITSLTGANVVGNISGNAATVTTNANLTGPVTSVGNATLIVGPINLSGSTSTIVTNSSVTAGAFFGDGSHLTGTAKGSSSQLQYNSGSGTMAGSNLTWDGGNNFVFSGGGGAALTVLNSGGNTSLTTAGNLSIAPPSGGQLTLNSSGVSGITMNVGGQGLTITIAGTGIATINSALTIGSSLTVTSGIILSSTTQGSIACDAGTPSLSATCTDQHCTYTAGAAAANCTYTFAKPWPKTPDCICVDDTSILAIKATASTTALICTAAVSLGGDNITFLCMGSP